MKVVSVLWQLASVAAFFAYEMWCTRIYDTAEARPDSISGRVHPVKVKLGDIRYTSEIEAFAFNAVPLLGPVFVVAVLTIIARGLLAERNASSPKVD